MSATVGPPASPSPAAGPVDHGAIDKTMRSFEEDWHWSISSEAKEIVHKFFNLLASDRLGFSVSMTKTMRNQALKVAYGTLRGFLDSIGGTAAQGPISEPSIQNVSPATASQTTSAVPDEPKIGGLLIVQNINKWAHQINCSCWPR